MTKRLGLSAAGMVVDEPKAVPRVGSVGGWEVGCSSWLEGRHASVVLSIQAVSRAEDKTLSCLATFLTHQVIAVAHFSVLA